MKALSIDSPNLKTRLSKHIPPATDITIIHLGRGGVTKEGTLDIYNKGRVLQTVSLAAVIEGIRPRAQVSILWTGGCNREQDRAGDKRPATEAGAALNYAYSLIGENDTVVMGIEERSTSTVENATRATALVSEFNTIVVVTDKLHYLAHKVQFIFWLAFPRRRVVFVTLPKSPPGTNAKTVAVHLVSTFITMLGMIGVHRGNADSIQRRQERLQQITGH